MLNLNMVEKVLKITIIAQDTLDKMHFIIIEDRRVSQRIYFVAATKKDVKKKKESSY